MPRPFSWIDHTGDVGVKVYGKDLTELLVHAAQALRETIVSGKGPEEKQPHLFQLQAASTADLLHHFLQELLFLFDTQQLLPLRVVIQEVSETGLQAQVWTDRMDPCYHTGKTELKAVTYHQLYVRKLKQGYEAQVIFDV